MKGTEKIIAHIEADAQAEVSAIMAEAEARTKEINISYENKARDVYEAAGAAYKKEAEDRLESAHRMSEMESKRVALYMKQEQISMAFNKAIEAIANLPEEQYEDFLIRLASSAILSGDEEVILNERDKERFGKILVENINKKTGKKLTLSKECRDFAGGLVLKRGNIEVNATLELLMEHAKRELSGEVAKVLFK